MPIYELESLNLTGLGGPMGSERIKANYRKFFASEEDAKRHAEGEYKYQNTEPINWKRIERNGHTWLTSGDLLYVEYRIEEVKVES